MEDPKRTVQQGYDQLGSRYRVHYEKQANSRYITWLTGLVERLPEAYTILELGCADGIPTAHFLSQYGSYLGVDISPVQIAQARLNVPQGQFKVADMTALSFPPATFDGIIALYSIIHLPIAEQPALFQSIYQWLKPEGYFLCVVGASEWTGVETDWITPQTTMYWSHADAATYQAWFLDTNFTVVENYFVAEGQGGHTYFLLQK